MSTILKVRLNLMISLNSFIVIIFCVTGQMLLNEASFNRRSELPHIFTHLYFRLLKFLMHYHLVRGIYEWNAEKKKILLIFLSNGLKTLRI
jgi:hypothetical protein